MCYISEAIVIIVILFVGSRYLTKFLKCRKSFLEHQLGNKHVVVTGGSSGIGKCIAILASTYGAHVTIIARNAKRLVETVEEIQRCRRSENQVIKYISLDCSHSKSVNDLLTGLDEMSPIYMLVNCAGLAIAKKLEDTTDDDIKTLIDANFYATVYPVRVLLPRMKDRMNGIIVITGSQSSLMGLYGYTIYSAAKFALRGFAESLHMELKPYNVSVTLAVPADTDTAGFAEENKTKPTATAKICKLGGLYAPHDMAMEILVDALDKNFFSYKGFASFFAANLCAGFAPCKSPFEFIWQTLTLGISRIIAICYTFYFNCIVYINEN